MFRDNISKKTDLRTKYFNPYDYKDLRAPSIVTAKEAKELSDSCKPEMDEHLFTRLTDRVNTLIIEAANRKEYKVAVVLPRDYWYQIVNQYRYWDYDVTVVERDKDAGSVVVKISWR
jgi:hypothetical protein